MWIRYKDSGVDSILNCDHIKQFFIYKRLNNGSLVSYDIVADNMNTCLKSFNVKDYKSVEEASDKAFQLLKTMHGRLHANDRNGDYDTTLTIE